MGFVRMDRVSPGYRAESDRVSMFLRRLISEWHDRLRRADAERAGETWLHAIRVRILTFLLARYADLPARPEHASSVIAAPPVAPRPRRLWLHPLPFCAVERPDGPPPRGADEIRSVLRDIRRCNQRRRWRFWP
jgi:hypothetical protein